MDKQKVYTVEVSGYPTTYTIEASNEDDARSKAREWYVSQFNRSVYQTEVIDVEDVPVEQDDNIEDTEI